MNLFSYCMEGIDHFAEDVAIKCGISSEKPPSLRKAVFPAVIFLRNRSLPIPTRSAARRTRRTIRHSRSTRGQTGC